MFLVYTSNALCSQGFRTDHNLNLVSRLSLVGVWRRLRLESWGWAGCVVCNVGPTPVRWRHLWSLVTVLYTLYCTVHCSQNVYTCMHAFACFVLSVFQSLSQVFKSVAIKEYYVQNSFPSSMSYHHHSSHIHTSQLSPAIILMSGVAHDGSILQS